MLKATWNKCHLFLLAEQNVGINNSPKIIGIPILYSTQYSALPKH